MDCDNTVKLSENFGCVLSGNLSNNSITFSVNFNNDFYQNFTIDSNDTSALLYVTDFNQLGLFDLTAIIWSPNTKLTEKINSQYLLVIDFIKFLIFKKIF